MADYAGFQQQGFDLTDKEIAILEREIIQVYRDAYKDMTAQLEKVYATLAGIDATDAGYYNALLKRDRLSTMLADITRTYGAYINKANLKTVTASKIGITNNYYRQLYASSWSGVVTFGVLPEEVVNVAVFGTAKSWAAYDAALRFGSPSNYQPKEGTLADILFNNKREQQAKIRQSITQGLIEGQSMTQMSNTIKDVTGREIVKDGKRTLTGGKANAMRIVRTETGRTMNAGAFAQSKELEAQGVDVQKRWLATLDVATRGRHARLDDKTIAIDEQFESEGDKALYPGGFGTVKMNANCRCAVIDIIPDFEPDVRTGRNPVTGKSELLSWQSYDEWAKNKGLKRSKSGRMIKVES